MRVRPTSNGRPFPILFPGLIRSLLRVVCIDVTKSTKELPSRARSSTGFTSLELISVIGICLLMAAMILPAIVRARARSREIACLNNVKEISLGMALYLNDHKRYPLGISRRDRLGAPASSLNEPRGLWHFDDAMGGPDGASGKAPPTRVRPLSRYSAPRIFECPSDRGFDLSASGGPKVQPSQFFHVGSSYSYNGGFTGDEPPWILDNKLPEWCKSPSQFVVFFERPAAVFYPGDDARLTCVYWHRSQKRGSAVGPQDKECGPRFSTIGFVDGHVEMVNFSNYYASHPGAGGCLWRQ